MRFAASFAASLAISSACPALADTPPTYLLSGEYETSSENVDGNGRSSSRGRTDVAERVVAESDAGTVLEYYLPGDPEDIRGAAMWMFPARMLAGADGSKQLLNSAELDQRLDEWLVLAELTREACGRWLFTWTAVQVECAPDAVITQIENYGLRPGRLADGTGLTVEGAAEPIVLRETGSVDGRRHLSGTAPVDPDAVRLSEAKARVVVAEVIGETLSLEQALLDAAGIDAAGTISVYIETDEKNLVWRRRTITEMEVSGLPGGTEKRRARHEATRSLFDPTR